MATKKSTKKKAVPKKVPKTKKKSRYRSAETGKMITKEKALKNPKTTVKERIK